MISSGRPNVRRFGVTRIARPPGSSMRTTSASTRSGSGTCSIDWIETTEAKLAVANGRAHVRLVGLTLLAFER